MTRFKIAAAAFALLPAPVLADDSTIVVTGTRSSVALPARQVGGSVTLIDANALADRQTRNISDLLRDVPGVAVSRIAGQTQVRVRGTEGNHVLVLIDGIEVSDPFQGEYDFGQLIADDGARLEVFRGQQSALYGSDAIGGVIQYITASGREREGFSGRIEGGSFNTANAAVRLGGVRGAFDYALTGTLNTTDGTPNARGGSRALGQENSAAALKTNWAVTDSVRMTAIVRYSKANGSSNDADYSNPASPTFGFIADTPGVGYATQSIYALMRGEIDLLNGRWTHALTAQFSDSRRDRFLFGTPTSGSRADRVKGSYETTLRFGEGSISHALTFAADLERESFRNADPSGFAFPGRESTDNIGLVGQYQLLIGDAGALSASVRHDFNNRFADATTFRVAGSYAFSWGTRLRGAIASGVKNPGFYELFGFIDGRYIGNPSLQPERSEGWEIGLEQSLFSGSLTLGGTYFDSRLTNEIFTVGFAPAVPGNRKTKSTQRGIELFAQARVATALRVDASFTRLTARENGIEEVRRPVTTASASVGWTAPGDRVTTTLVARYNGRQSDTAFIVPPFGSPRRVDLPDYVLVNLNVDAKLTPQLSFNARIENLLDADYEDVFSFQNPGRAVYAGLKLRL